MKGLFRCILKIFSQTINNFFQVPYIFSIIYDFLYDFILIRERFTTESIPNRRCSDTHLIKLFILRPTSNNIQSSLTLHITFSYFNVIRSTMTVKIFSTIYTTMYTFMKVFRWSCTPVLTEWFAGVGTRTIELFNVPCKLTGNWIPSEFVGHDKANRLIALMEQVFIQAVNS